MAQDLLTTYKYGWKTSYYQNTYDNKTDEVEPIAVQDKTSEVGFQGHTQLENLISELENVEECESCAI